MRVLIFHALWGASAPLATVAKGEKLACQSIPNSPYQGVFSQLVPAFHHRLGQWSQRELFLWFRDRCRQWLDLYWDMNFKLCRCTKSSHFYTVASVQANGKFIKDFPLSGKFTVRKRKRAFWAKEENTDVKWDLRCKLGKWDIYQTTILELVFFSQLHSLHLCKTLMSVPHPVFTKESQR